jgi:hypothetical protein
MSTIIYQTLLNRYSRQSARIASYNVTMKPLPAPEIKGKTEFEKFDNAVRQVLSVSKEELLKRESQEKRTRERKKRAKK